MFYGAYSNLFDYVFVLICFTKHVSLVISRNEPKKYQVNTKSNVVQT